ncbi:MAG TPA: prenyltransferase/squalene oxidase repeat-containing protein [Planctomycetota bacterium]|nr:prenyltransferase/squalene oxidase repeat-containing protein [Planctomycetota bacterium]
MARGQVEEELDEEMVEGEEEGQEEGNQPFLYSMTGHTPWWIVSILLHCLVIALAGLISMAIELPKGDDANVTVTELAPRPEVKLDAEKLKTDSKHVLESKHDTPPTDPTSPDASDIVVPPEILAKAEIGDHFETINPDRPDTQSAFGNPDAHMFHSEKGSDDAAGGGGNEGASLDDMIGVGGAASPGSGGGWGGGHGTGTGVDNGSGRGSFGQRNGGGRRLMVKRHGGSKGTENAVDAALRWLAYHQEPDGHWDSKKYGGLKVDTANTGLALLAFLGAGHTEKVGEYKDNVKRAVAWLKSKQDAQGLVFDTTDEGGHRGIGYPSAIATMALAEAAGMANVADTKAAAQKAINYCTEIHQQGEGSEKLGFRYAAKSAGDISVTGWFVMALKSAKVAGLAVNHASFDGAIKFIDKVEVKNAGQGDYGPASRYQYTPGSEPNHRRGAIGNLCRQFLGWKKEDLQSSVELFMKDGGVPSWGANGESVDLYYWYYGTLCVFQQGGDLWKRWNESMKKALVENQCKNGDDAGSWDPKGAFASEWGRVGQTALGALCLEVYYRYLQLQPDAK